MRIRAIAILAAGLALSALGTATIARADDAPPTKAKVRVMTFGDGVAKFEVNREATSGKMTFHLVDANVKLAQPPVVTLQTAEGPQEVTLTEVSGQPGTWTFTNDVIRREKFDGTMAIVVDGKTYTSAINLVDVVPTSPTAPGTTLVARHGGTIVTFPDCKASVEVLHDAATGTVTLYSSDDVQIVEAPVITLSSVKSPANVTLTKVEGQAGVWMIKNETFKTKAIAGTIRLMINGHPCVTTLRGGNVVTIENGPRWEVVPQANNSYRFYVLDERYDNRPVVIENPSVVVGERTYTLTPVPGEPRAYDLVGLDAAASRGDAMLRFSLFGRSLETRVGLSGIGVGVR
jgi:hypothetical protein